MLFCITLLALCSTGLACPDLKLVTNFDISKISQGTWYEIARYNSFDVEKDADCITYTFIPTKNGDHVYTIKEINKNKTNTINGTLRLTDVPGKVTFDVNNSATPKLPVMILDTDSENYIIFYNCIKDEATKQEKEYSWIAAKTPTISPKLKSIIHKYIDETHILDASKFLWDHLTHEDCLTNDKQS